MGKLYRGMQNTSYQTDDERQRLLAHHFMVSTWPHYFQFHGVHILGNFIETFVSVELVDSVAKSASLLYSVVTAIWL